MTQGRKAATVGTFDGVHRGHIAVIERLKDVAREAGLEPTVITFDRHPLSVIAPQRAPARLMTPPQEAEALRRRGVEVEVVPFTPELMRLTAAQWLQRMHSEMGIDSLVVGYDNTFGSDGVEMSVADYVRLGDEAGIRVVQAPIVDGVSSSAIRKALYEGDIAKANEMLGYRYRISGRVVFGRQLGRTIGFPTANIRPDANALIPADGVYAADAVTADGRRYRAVVNIGRRPTVGNDLARTIEAHLIGFEGDLYDQTVGLEMIKCLRGEQKFDDMQQLRQQIEADAAEALRLP